MLPFSLDDAWIAQLVALPSQAQQVAALGAAQLLDEAGLSQLLTYAHGLVQRNPDQVRQLALLGEHAAQAIASAPLQPRFRYLRAQSHAINGELPLALEVVRAARATFLTLGLVEEGMRTIIGEMRVLGEQGDFQAALTAGETLQEWLATAPPGDLTDQLTALLYTQQGICYNQLGRYQAALTVFPLAEAIYERCDMAIQHAATKNSRGLTLLYLGRVSEALTLFTAALQIQMAEDLPLLQAHTQSNLGETYLLLGDYRAALAAYEQACQLLADQAALTDEQINRRQMADAYLALNLVDEALSTYREVIAKLDQAGMEHERAWALWGAGAALASQGQHTAAAEALHAAAGLFARVENQPLLAAVQLEQGALAEAAGEAAAAMQLTQAALDLLATGDWPVQQLFAYLRRIDLTLAQGGTAVADLAVAQSLADQLRLPHLSYRLAQRWGQQYLQQGDKPQAIHHFEQAVAAIEQLRDTLPLETMRIAFLRDKLSAYELLVQLYLERGDPASLQASFEMAERARSRALIERMVGMTATQASHAQEEALVARLHALQADLHAVYNRLLQRDLNAGQQSNSERSRHSSELYTRATLLEQEISRLRLTLERTTFTPDRFMPLPLETIQAHLTDTMAVVAYYLIDEEVVAFVVTGTTLQVIRHLTTRTQVALLLQRLHSQWQRFRAGQAFAERHAALLTQSTQRILAELYKELFAPVAAGLSTAFGTPTQLPQLTIVPYGLLHQVPFQALFDGTDHLLERFLLSYAPSVTALVLVPPVAPVDAATSFVVGVSDNDLPAVADEVQQVAAQLPAAQIYLNDGATIARLTGHIAEARLLHFACHAIFRADNPMFSALKLADGWLTALEIAQLPLRCSLVVLSACESGLGYTTTGDEILGLTRAFLSVGVSTLVVSQWMVQDEAAAALMMAFYQQLAQGQLVAAALRHAQLVIKARLPHPYYWAPFIVVGQPSLRVMRET